MSLSRKNVVITGGSRGIGKAIVDLTASKDANVFFTYLNNENAAKNVERLNSAYVGKVKAYLVDVKERSHVKRFVNEIIKEYGDIDVLINNAGVRSDKSLLYMGDEDWNHVINTNLTGVFYMTKEIIPYMMKRKTGRIINISSVSGIYGIAGQTNYSSSKAGIIGFTKALAKETAKFGICVNAVAPGPVETEMLDGLTKEYIDRLLANVPIKRLCSPMEVAMMANFLADDELSPQYLTGQVFSLDGGMGL